MQAVVSSVEPQLQDVTVSKTKFKTVLGLGNPAFKDNTIGPGHKAGQPRRPSYLTRRSTDAARSYKKRKQRQDRSSVTDTLFFEPDAIIIPSTAENTTPIPSVENMRPIDMNMPRRPPVRMDAQDGPWSVSVAETPYDARSYSLYIKTPTHNLTLTRTAMEIVDLHQRLSDSSPGAKLPSLPIDVATLPAPPAKRKSTFLNTLSRLASPSSNRSARQVSNRQRSGDSGAIPSNLPTPAVSPSHETSDPFASFSAATNGLESSTLSSGTHANSTVTGLASYLTSISNEPTLRHTRHWKRFVRVRPDDLESVRVERAIKRVRSDLASHVSPKSPEVQSSKGHSSSSNVSVAESHEDSVNGLVNGDMEASVGSLREEGIAEEEEGDANPHVDEEEDTMTVEGQTSHDGTAAGEKAETSLTPIDVLTATSQVLEEDASTPMPPESPAPRIPRSQSADPDKATRLSRVYTNQEGASSQTGDESSISTTPGDLSGRKKRSRSSDPKRELKKSQRKVVVNDFEMLRVLGKGCAGKVLLVRHKSTTDLYALKAITKRHVLAHQELQHTLTEQAVLKRMAAESKDPFVVKLWWSFHDKENLFLVMDFHPGGDLATQLARWGRLGRDRARFYAAEIVEGVEGLHAAGVIYRDLKPENILIGADGHIVLTDFGLSKEFPRRIASITAPSTPSGSRSGEFYSSSPASQPASQPATPPWMKSEKGQDLAAGWPGQAPGQGDSTSTFCGTAEYLAPEVIQGLHYSYEVDWWSFGTMLYEMLTGITPFWANNHSDMYVRVLQDELQFPDDRAIDQDTKSLIRGLLQRNPALRMCEPRIKRHPYFSMIDWSHVYYKRYIPPYIPPIDPSNASDTQNFDDTFLDMEPIIDDPNEMETDTDQEREQTDTDRTDGEESNTTPSQSRSPSVVPRMDDSVDVFDGYSFKGRHSILIDSDSDESDEGDEDEDESSVAEAEVLKADIQTLSVNGEVSPEERTPEPKTPEAHQPPLPEPTVDVVTPAAEPPAEEEILAPAHLSKEELAPEPLSAQKSVVPTPAESKRLKPKSTKGPTTRPSVKASRVRREKSGVAALDRDLSDTIDEDEEVTEKEDDDDWDFVEAADGEDRNGAQGTSLFARGVVDRYRLAVFRKASTPVPTSSRSFSGTSKASDVDGPELADSPTPSDKQRRGRTQGLTFRKHPRQFLRPKSPHSKKSGATKSLNHSTSASLSVSTTSSPSMLTPSPSLSNALPVTPSLKSKESHASSVGTHSGSSDQSPNADSTVLDGSVTSNTSKNPPPPSTTATTEEPEKMKNKKLKKYKEGAEKVLSLFASPRQS